MTATYPEAIDQIYGLFNLEWNANSAAIVGYNPEIRWPGVEEDTIPPADKFWCRISQQTLDEPQTTLRNGLGEQRYTASGLVFIQLFCPKSDTEGMDKGKKLAQVAKKAFRGKTTSGKVWFRNARIQELAPEDNAYRFNIVAEYTYDEIN